ncbi:MAG: capsular polysaccharide biosynthesis protein [Pseudomonadota bacterium]
MSATPKTPTAGTETPRRLCVYNGGFLTGGRIRRILELSGWQVRVGIPRDGDWIGVWGQSPTAPRGEAVASATQAPILRVEDAFLRSLHPGRTGEPPLGLLLDKAGVHFDPAQPSDLENLLATHPLEDPMLLARARAANARLTHWDLAKFAAIDPGHPLPDPGYVLVIDQTQGDAAVTASGADTQTFHDMLAAARAEHPGHRIVIKTHPETDAGHRPGYLHDVAADKQTEILTGPVSPWRLFEGAAAIYTVSSGLGFEAVIAGHTPNVFGQPFYAGWGLTRDRAPIQRRTRVLSRAQLFAGAMILYPKWYDPYRDRLCTLDTVISTQAAMARAWRDDRDGWVAGNMALWKRGHIRRFFGTHGGLRFGDRPDPPRRRMVWASIGNTETEVTRVEDGFLRSRGLGAALTPPLSLVADDLGIYYDPSRESRLERLIAASVDLPQAELDRAAKLTVRICRDGLTKYNLGPRALPPVPQGRRILVPGQVEDDASIIRGAGRIMTNMGLLSFVRAQNPDAIIIYKPHPDVEAGLRAGAVDPARAAEVADVIATHTEAHALLEDADEVWTITSLLGFEALLRGLSVTCTGVPFYAGWGLTQDLGEAPDRRTARPTLTQLAHAVLIGYPRYRDPVSGLPCPPEVVADRLARGEIPAPGAGNRVLSKLQGAWATVAPGRRR